MKNNLKMLLIILAICLFARESFAYNLYSTGDAGSEFLKDFEGLLRGATGVTVGFVISLVGMFSWLWHMKSWGLVVALFGALISAFPDMYVAMKEFGQAAFQSSLGQKSTGTYM